MTATSSHLVQRRAFTAKHRVLRRQRGSDRPRMDPPAEGNSTIATPPARFATGEFAPRATNRRRRSFLIRELLDHATSGRQTTWSTNTIMRASRARRAVARPLPRSMARLM